VEICINHFDAAQPLQKIKKGIYDSEEMLNFNLFAQAGFTTAAVAPRMR
jgi:hypothetical protein